MTDWSESQSASSQSNDWFSRLLTETLKRYGNKASANFLVKKYKGWPKDEIAKKYIKQQARMAALAGAISATAVSAAAIGSVALASSIVSIPGVAITIPVGLAAVWVEIKYTVRLQIQTAYELCNLYGLSFNLDDPEDVQEIFAIGMGIKAGESIGNVLQRLAPGVAMQQTRRFMRTGIRRSIQDWAAKNLSRQIARRYLTEKVLLNAIVPVFSIVLAGGWNYYFTKGLGRTIQTKVRGRGMSSELIQAIEFPSQAKPELLLASALNIMGADSRVSENEIAAYKELAARLNNLHPDFIPENLGSQWGDANIWLAQIASVEDGETREAIYAIAETMTIIDGRVRRKEVKRLRQIAKLLGVQIDKARLKMRAQTFYVRPVGRGCGIMAAIIGALLLIGGCAASIWLWYFVAQLLQR
jgi:uncharacterized tellurite resistance protein B-like protein